jgi:methyl-accepting chemotaxis protein
MQGSITWNELGVFIVFVFFAVAGGYAVITLKNMNRFIKEAAGLLQKNKDQLNEIIPNIHEISVNTKNISKNLRKSVEEAGEAVRTISHETTDTVLTITETADSLAKYALVIGEIVKMLVNMFSSSEKTEKGVK